MKKSFCYQNETIVSYAECGNEAAFPILINHGLIAGISDFQLFERLIGLGARLICIARPGYGESSPYEMQTIAEWGEIVSALVDHLELSRFDVLGMSSGAPYSYAIGYRLPDRARNIYIFSGIPALFDHEVQSHWPYEVNQNASITELQKLAHELFFSNLSAEDLAKAGIQDSMQNDCFGIALDLKLRCRDWGFSLSDVKQTVHMQHSRFDREVPFLTALRTSMLLPNCQLNVKETDEHFSKDALDHFLQVAIAGRFQIPKA